MSEILIIDSASSMGEATTIAHVRNSVILSEHLKADLYFMGENDPNRIKDEHETILFVHASGYTEAGDIVDRLKTKPRKYFYITNEYNLGQAIPIWALSIKHGYIYEVIGNHEQKANRRLKSEKPISKWHTLNLNCLLYNPVKPRQSDGLFDLEKQGIIYYGTIRKDRVEYFKKYFDKRIFFSSSDKNHIELKQYGIEATFIDKLMWVGDSKRLDNFVASLYIEDTHTHRNYNYLANRFYECLSYNVPLFFDRSCMNTIEKSGYNIDDFWIVDSKEELHDKTLKIPNDFTYPKEFHQKALQEKQEILNEISDIVCRQSTVPAS